MLSIALQLYSIREDMEKDFKGCLAAVKAMGYDGIEFAGLYGQSATAVREMLRETGLTPISAHVPYVDMMADPDGVLGTYAEISCRFVAVPYLTEEYRIGAAKGEEAVAGIRMLGEKAKKLGMTLLYHNHDFEFEKLDSEYKLDLLYKAVPADLLQTELDTCWIRVAGEDPAGYVRKYAGRSPIVHLKDYFTEGGSGEGAYELIGIKSDKTGSGKSAFEFRPVGSGLQDMPAILAAAEAAGAKWVVVEQDMPTPGKTALECAKVSIDYLKRFFRE